MQQNIREGFFLVCGMLMLGHWSTTVEGAVSSPASGPLVTKSVSPVCIMVWPV